MEPHRTGHKTERDTCQKCCGHSAVFVHLVFHFRVKMYIRIQRVINQLSERGGRHQSIFH